MSVNPAETRPQHSMADQSDPTPEINSWLEEELYQTYLHDRKYVDESWKSVFESNGHNAPAAPSAAEEPRAVTTTRAAAPAAPAAAPEVALNATDELVPMRGA